MAQECPALSSASSQPRLWWKQHDGGSPGAPCGSLRVLCVLRGGFGVGNLHPFHHCGHPCRYQPPQETAVHPLHLPAVGGVGECSASFVALL